MQLTDEDLDRIVDRMSAKHPKMDISATVANWWPLAVAVLGIAVMWGSLNSQVIALQTQLNEQSSKLARVEEMLTAERVSGDRWTSQNQNRYEASVEFRFTQLEARVTHLESER